MSVVPIIIVFESALAPKLLNFFEQEGHFALYDHKHGRDYQWYQKNIVNNHRLYSIKEGLVYDFTMDDLNPEMLFWPQFLISMQEGVSASDEQWYHILGWLSQLTKEVRTYDAAIVEQVMVKPQVAKIVMERESDEYVEHDGFGGFVTHLPPNFKKPDGPYEFHRVYLEERDTMLFQVNRPGTLLPFTIVVEHFKKRGLDDTRFFTDIYGSNDWGRSRYDHPYDFGYLCWQWEQLGLPGSFTMDVVKERVRRCYPERLLEGENLEAEPIVYRSSIGNVIETLKDKDNGSVTGQLPESIKKRRVY